MARTGRFSGNFPVQLNIQVFRISQRIDWKQKKGTAFSFLGRKSAQICAKLAAISQKKKITILFAYFWKFIKYVSKMNLGLFRPPKKHNYEKNLTHFFIHIPGFCALVPTSRFITSQQRIHIFNSVKVPEATLGCFIMALFYYFVLGMHCLLLPGQKKHAAGHFLFWMEFHEKYKGEMPKNKK